jgi:hypothetical protein
MKKLEKELKRKKKTKIIKLWCWLCKKTQNHQWFPKKGEGIADGRYRCNICDSMYYGR